MICWLQVTSGRGPTEYCCVVTQVVQHIIEESAELNLDVRILETTPSDKTDLFKSALLTLVRPKVRQ